MKPQPSLAQTSCDVLIYDSGVGGLSIAQSIQNHLPSLHQLYVSDNAAFPYGLKEEEWLIRRVGVVLQSVLRRWQPKMIVMACNTASTVVLPSLRQRLSIPIIGVVPAIKPAAKLSRSKHIAMIATPATIQRPYTLELIKSFAADCHVIKIGSSRLVEVAEEKLRGKEIVPEELRQILSPLFQGAKAIVDVAVLGCTHFPLLQPELVKYVSTSIQWIDSGAAIAKRVEELLAIQYPTGHVSKPHNHALLTRDGMDLATLKLAFQDFAFASLQVLEVPV